MAVPTYSSDVVAITTQAQSALTLSANDVADAGALDPEQYVASQRNIGGAVQVYAGFVKWFVTERYTNGKHLFADQYAVSIVCRSPEDFDDCKSKAATLRNALNGLAYKVGGSTRKMYVTDGFPRFMGDDLSVNSIQFFVDIV